MILSIATSLALLPALSQEPASSTTSEQRYEALTHLVEEMQRSHPDLYYGLSEEEFFAAQYALLEQLDDLTDDQFVAGMMRLVASISLRAGRDGHAGLFPIDRWHTLPLSVYPFADGWYVLSCMDSSDDLTGAHIVTIGDRPTAQVVERLAPLVPRDNEHDVLNKLPGLILMPELLHALGLSASRESITLGLELDGERREVTLAGKPLGEVRAWRRALGGPLPRDTKTLWLSAGSRAWWMRELDGADGERVLYAQYNQVLATDASEGSLGDFAAGLVGTFEQGGIERVVLDVRLNGGGDNTTFGPLIRAIQGSQSLNRRGKLYALIGRHTFSAAGNFITVLQRDSAAILVGEPTGGAPNQYGDARRITPPHFPWLRIAIATRYHVFGGEDDERVTHEPELPVALNAADYFAGRDPVLEAALTHRAERP